MLTQLFSFFHEKKKKNKKKETYKRTIQGRKMLLIARPAELDISYYFYSVDDYHISLSGYKYLFPPVFRGFKILLSGTF